jgi:hypothetical protein
MCCPTAAPCTTQLPMSRQVRAPQFCQRFTARSIFDRCGDRRKLTFISASPGHPSGRPGTNTTNSTHLKHVFADRRATQNPTPHVAPGVCSAILSTNDRTVDFRPLRRPTNAHISARHGTHQDAQADTKSFTRLKNVFANRRAMHNPTPHVAPGATTPTRRYA